MPLRIAQRLQLCGVTAHSECSCLMFKPIINHFSLCMQLSDVHAYHQLLFSQQSVMHQVSTSASMAAGLRQPRGYNK